MDENIHNRFWTETGTDRLGVVCIARDDRVVRLLKKHFNLDCRWVNGVRAEVVQPISADLELKIEALLKSIPEYADYPFIHFHVQTNNTFERVNYMDGEWGLLDLGPEAKASLLVTATGFGDGGYPVMVSRQGEAVVTIEIPFIDPVAEGVAA